MKPLPFLSLTFALAAPAAGSSAQDIPLENAYVRVTRNAAHCARAGSPGCGDRVIVALGDIALATGTTRRTMQRGDIAVFGPTESYAAPAGGDWLEVAIKPDHPRVLTPPERILPSKNVVLHESDRLFIFEERLAVGETRERHSHNQRVVIQLNRTRLRQWPDGEPELVRDIEAGRIAFNEPVIHKVTNVGDQPLRGVVIELKP